MPQRLNKFKGDTIVASECQVEANRLNAQRSTGPRTPEGKAKVAMNALKHGLTAKKIVLVNEDPQEFDAFHSAMWAALDPQGALEELLAERVVADAWRLRRVPVFEAALHVGERQRLLIQELEARAHSYLTVVRPGLSDMIRKDMENTSTQYEALPANHEGHQRAIAELKEARTQLKENFAIQFTEVLKQNASQLAMLWQREEVLARSMVRMLHELQRLQAMRAGIRVAPPAALEMDVSITNAAVASSNDPS
jgi:hypothetical protein